MSHSKVSSGERKKGLAVLKGWTALDERDAIQKTFEFENFSSAFAFITRVAMAAEKQNHHPEIHNTYATVRIVLTTHDAGGVSAADFTLARSIDEITG